MSVTAHTEGPSAGGSQLISTALAGALRAGDARVLSAELDAHRLRVNDHIVFSDYSDTPAAAVACTCLHYAAVVGAPWAVAWLLQHGADPTAVDAAGRVPAAVSTNPDVTSQLKQAADAWAATLSSGDGDGLATTAPDAVQSPPRNYRDLSSVSVLSSDAKDSDDPPARTAPPPALAAAEAALRSQLATVSACQSAVATHTGRAQAAGERARASEAALAQLQSAQKKAVEAAAVRERRVEQLLLDANERLASLDCREAVLEAQAADAPPPPIKHLLIAVHTVLQEAVPAALSPSTTAADTAWARCHAFLRTDEFLDVMFQAAPGQLPAPRIAAVRAQLERAGVTQGAVAAACAVYEPVFHWLDVHLTASEGVLAVGGGDPDVEATLRSGDDHIERAWEDAQGQRERADAARGVLEAARAGLATALADARVKLDAVVRLRLQHGVSVVGLWDGSDSLTSIAAAVGAGDVSAAAASPRPTKRLPYDVDESKFSSPRSSPHRRRSVGESSPSNASRPVSRGDSPLTRHRRASLGAVGPPKWSASDSKDSGSCSDGDGTRGDNGGEDGTAAAAVELWPDDSLLSEIARRRASTHSHSPLRRQSFVFPSEEGPPELPPSGLLVRRKSVQNPTLDAPQLRRVRLSTVDTLADPDLVPLSKPLARSGRSNSDSSSSLLEVFDSSGGHGEARSGSPPSGTAGDSGPSSGEGGALHAVRRSSVVSKASPLRRKSNVGLEGLGDVGGTAGTAAAAAAAGAQPDPSLRRVRRMSVDVNAEPLEATTAAFAFGGRSSVSPVSPGQSLSPRLSPTPVGAGGVVAATSRKGSAPSTSSSLSAVASVPGATAAASDSTPGLGDGVSPATALRRASIVQRPSPLRRMSSMEPTGPPGPVDRRASSGPASSTSQATTANAGGSRSATLPGESPEPKPFLSPGNSAFRRCLSQSPHEAATGKSPTPEPSPTFAVGVTTTDGAVAVLGPQKFTFDGTDGIALVSAARELSGSAVLVPGRTPVRVVRDAADASAPSTGTPTAPTATAPSDASLLLTPTMPPTLRGDSSTSVPTSARRLSVRSARRLSDALQYGEELASKVVVASPT